MLVAAFGEVALVVNLQIRTTAMLVPLITKISLACIMKGKIFCLRMDKNSGYSLWIDKRSDEKL